MVLYYFSTFGGFSSLLITLKFITVDTTLNFEMSAQLNHESH